MEKIRPQAVSGMFYPENKDEVSNQLAIFKENTNDDYEYKTRAIIVPHAGWIYSGALAAEGFATLDENVENVFIIAPAHKMLIEGIALCDFEAWETPLGALEVNLEINEELVLRFGAKVNNSAHEDEHGIEVQLPFVESYLKNVKIVPILLGNVQSEKVQEIISYYYENSKNAFVISSDLSHYYPDKDAKKIDSITALMIEKGEIENFEQEQACNAPGVVGLVKFAKEKNYSLIRVGMKNSGEVTGDRGKVVGYGSWMLFEGEKNYFLKKYFEQYAKLICKRSIAQELKSYSENYHLTSDDLGHFPPVFSEFGACFVTLEIEGNLRGCVGSILAHQPLIDDLIKNAYNAAFYDPRFVPLSEEEFKNVSIAISLLSIPSQMKFENEEDLIFQIKKGVDGIIIKDGDNQAVYLPSVWEQLPNKRDFLGSLKQKAGLRFDYFSNTFEAYRFRVEYIR